MLFAGPAVAQTAEGQCRNWVTIEAEINLQGVCDAILGGGGWHAGANNGPGRCSICSDDDWSSAGPEDLVTDPATLDAIMAKGMEVCGAPPRKAPPANTWKFYSPATGLGETYYFAGGDAYLCAENLDSFFWTGSRYHNFSCSGSSCARRESWDGRVGAQLPLSGTVRRWEFLWHSYPARDKDELRQVQ